MAVGFTIASFPRDLRRSILARVSTSCRPQAIVVSMASRRTGLRRLAGRNLAQSSPLSARSTKKTTYTRSCCAYSGAGADPIDVYVVKPKGVKNPPVILYLYGYPAETDIFRNEAIRRSRDQDGFAAVGFVAALTGHRYHDRPMREWFISELQESLATSAHDVQMMLDYLAARNDLDMNRVGFFGQGAGASIGILASAVDPANQSASDALDPWGDWPTWMATSPFVPEEERAAIT